MVYNIFLSLNMLGRRDQESPGEAPMGSPGRSQPLTNDVWNLKALLAVCQSVAMSFWGSRRITKFPSCLAL